MRERTRSEHLAWCKDRARKIARGDDLMRAYKSMMSGLRAHPETSALVTKAAANAGWSYANAGDVKALRAWINSF